MIVPIGLGAVAVAVAVGTLVLPRLTHRYVGDARPATDAELARVRTLRDRAGLDVDRTYVVEAGGDESVAVSVRGPPGWRALFLSDAVLETLDEADATALLAAETGRVETAYEPFRAAAVGVVIALLAAIFTVPIAFELGLAAMGGFALVAFAIGRRLQFAADARAADRVGADRLATVFERVADRRGVEPESGSWRTVFEIQPPLGDRIERLRERGDRAPG